MVSSLNPFHLIISSLFFLPLIHSRAIESRAPGWTLEQKGTTGVASMQFAIVSPTLAVIIDKVESNAFNIDGHPAWGALYNLETNEARPLDLRSNTFCAGGTFLSNGSFISLGGNGVVDSQYGDSDGFQAIRVFGPCKDHTGKTCGIYDDPTQLHLARPRWYPATLRIYDGSALIMGGTASGGFYNNVPANNEASYEFFPPKNGGQVLPSQFLQRTVPANLFPLALALSDGTIFVAANNQAIIYNIMTNTETPLPDLPNGVRVTYPFSGTAALLPLSPPNYVSEVLICGGSNIKDTLKPSQISSQTPASNQCVRMVLDKAGIKAGWQVEHMLEPRVMPELVHLPNGQLVLINGAKTGVAGYAGVQDLIGASNADHPAFTPALYTPTAESGSRFSEVGMPTSNIARLYHSTAMLTPMGNIIIAGSNPNNEVSQKKYATEYRVEYLNPPYMALERPVMQNPPARLAFKETVNIEIAVPAGLDNSKLKVALMDLGFTTHATHSQGRLVWLDAAISRDRKTLRIIAPPNGFVYPPGPAWLYVTVDDVTSTGASVLVGPGGNPPVAFQ